MRHLPAGLLGRVFEWAFVAVSAAVFLLAAGAYMLTPPLALSGWSESSRASSVRPCKYLI